MIVNVTTTTGIKIIEYLLSLGYSCNSKLRNLLDNTKKSFCVRIDGMHILLWNDKRLLDTPDIEDKYQRCMEHQNLIGGDKFEVNDDIIREDQQLFKTF